MKLLSLLNRIVVVTVVLASLHAMSKAQDVVSTNVGAPLTAAPTPDEAIKMSPAAFDAWVASERNKYDETKTSKPLNLEVNLMKRLGNGAYVSDDAVAILVRTWLGYESEKSRDWRTENQPDGPSKNFPETLRIVDLLIESLYKRPALIAKLHDIKADVLLLDNDREGARKEYEETYRLSRALSIQTDQQWVESLLLAGEATLKSGDKKKAEKMFAEVLSYNWIALYNYPEAIQFFQALYIRAGKGIIQTRRGDLEALKGTFFYPSVMSELGPYKEAALKEAQGKEANE